MQKTNKYSRFVLMLCVATLTAASALATGAQNALNNASSAIHCKVCKKDKDIVKTALRKALKRGINPHLTTSYRSNQVKQRNAAKMALAKRKLNKRLLVNKARTQTQSTKSKAKSFIKSLFTGFMGMKMRK